MLAYTLSKIWGAKAPLATPSNNVWYDILLSGVCILIGMMSSVEVVKNHLRQMRSDETFNATFDQAEAKIGALHLSKLQLPRKRKVPGDGEDYLAPSAKDHHRRIFFQFVDLLDSCMQNRFDHSKNALSKYNDLQNMLLTGQVNSTLVKEYPELTEYKLRIQLSMFLDSTKCKSLQEAKIAYPQ